MRLQITHLKAPWPSGAVVGDVLDLPEIPAWAAGKCVHVGDDVELTIVTGDGTGEALQPIDSGEGEGAGQHYPGIERESGGPVAGGFVRGDNIEGKEVFTPGAIDMKPVKASKK